MTFEKLRKTGGKGNEKKRERKINLKEFKVEKYENKKKSLKCELIKLPCVVANAYVETYYRLILSILLDQSFIHMASSIQKLHKSLSYYM